MLYEKTNCFVNEQLVSNTLSARKQLVIIKIVIDVPLIKTKIRKLAINHGIRTPFS